MALSGGGQRPSAGNASRSQRTCIGAVWGSRSAREGVSLSGVCIAQSVGVRRGCVGERKYSGRACRCAGRAKASAGNASRSRRASVGAAWGSGSARRGRVAVRGRAKVFGEEWVVRSAGLTHICRSGSRARIYYNIRPPCPCREIAVLGSKSSARVHTSPASPSAAPAEQSASRSSSYPQWVIHGKVIHIVARHPVQNVLALAPAHAYI